jgi:hypothetical protein
MTTIIMSFSAANAATGLWLDLEHLIFWQLISSFAKLSAITGSSKVKLDTIEGLQSSDGYELWSYKISVIIEGNSYYKIDVMGIDPSPLISAEELITF